MIKKRNRIFVFLISLLMLTALLTTAALAQGKIDTEQPVKVTVRYLDGEKPIPGARFRAYRVAELNEYGDITLTETFAAYRNTVSGLDRLEKLTQEEWAPLITTLRSCVLRDGIPCTAEGLTEENGELTFPELPAGIYLFLGSRATTDDFYTYTAAPFMLHLPGRNNENNTWDHEVTASPKYTKEYNPPEEDDDYVTRKVLKIWDDEGYESVRPKEITVQLLKDGIVYDTQVLNKENNWRYAWDNLDADCEWLVTEEEPENYAVTIEQSGITFTVCNKYVVPITGTNVPIQKRITENKPEKDSTFTFVLTAKDASFPMPEGSEGSTKTLKITGAGSVEIGEISFEKPGIYEYTIHEENGGVKGYTYDKTVYTLRYEVTQEGSELKCTCTILNDKGNAVQAVVFTNPYTPEIPYTGSLWWPVPVLLCAGLIFIMIGVIRRRKVSE